jgi:uncharacterized membrane protein YcaP (DUF421 family)
MEPVSPFEWERLMFGVEPPLYLFEIVLRVVLIYAFAVYALRFMGKRGRQALSPFELVLIIALGSATGDAMFYPEVPVVYAWLIITVVVVLDRLLATWEVRSDGMKVFLAGRPRLMVKDGKVIQESLDKEALPAGELLALLREKDVADLSLVGYAFLETTGKLAVIERGQFESASHSTYPEDLAQ